MTKYALLCGSAPDGMMQKKVDGVYDSLLAENGGRFEENEIMIFPNGIDEASLAYVLNNLRMSGIEQVLLYVCTVTPVEDSEKTIWLGGNEIRKVIFEKPAALTEFIERDIKRSCREVSDMRCATIVPGGIDLSGDACGGEFSVQVVYDSDREFVDGGEYYLDAECAMEMWGAGDKL